MRGCGGAGKGVLVSAALPVMIGLRATTVRCSAARTIWSASSSGGTMPGRTTFSSITVVGTARTPYRSISAGNSAASTTSARMYWLASASNWATRAISAQCGADGSVSTSTRTRRFSRLSLRLISGGNVQAMNVNLVPEWKSFIPELQSPGHNTVNGVHYGVPYQWGPNILMYNIDVFPEAPKSWDVTFEEMDLPDGQSNKGRVQAYDGPIYMADAALYLKFHNPELGIDNPYDLNQEQFDAVVALLQKQRELISRYWHDAYVQMDDFKNEGVVASGSWPFQVNLLAFEGAPIASTFPQEGATGWSDTTMMHVDAPHPNCAYKWLKWSLNPKLQGDLAAWFGSVPAVPAACKGNELLTDTGCSTNGFDNFDKIWFWRTPTAECSTGKGGCIPYSKWVEAYVGIISQ